MIGASNTRCQKCLVGVMKRAVLEEIADNFRNYIYKISVYDISYIHILYIYASVHSICKEQTTPLHWITQQCRDNSRDLMITSGCPHHQWKQAPYNTYMSVHCVVLMLYLLWICTSYWTNKRVSVIWDAMTLLSCSRLFRMISPDHRNRIIIANIGNITVIS